APFVLIRACQKSVAAPELMSVFVVASMLSKRPTPKVVVTTLFGGVARAGTTNNAVTTTVLTPSPIAARTHLRRWFISPPPPFEVWVILFPGSCLVLGVAF